MKQTRRQSKSNAGIYKNVLTNYPTDWVIKEINNQTIIDLTDPFSKPTHKLNITDRDNIIAEFNRQIKTAKLCKEPSFDTENEKYDI